MISFFSTIIQEFLTTRTSHQLFSIIYRTVFYPEIIAGQFKSTGVLSPTISSNLLVNSANDCEAILEYEYLLKRAFILDGFHNFFG